MEEIAELQEDVNRREREIRETEEKLRLDRIQLEQDKAAIRHVIELRNRLHPSRPVDLVLEPGIQRGPTDIFGVVRKTVEDLMVTLNQRKGSFSSRSIAYEIAKMPVFERPFDLEKNKANISFYLKEFHKAGRIEILEKGRGTLPTIYKLPPTPAPENSQT